VPTSMEGPERPGGEAARRIVAIASGGALGTLARYGTARALSGVSTGFPWATLAVNLAGSLVLGAVVTLVMERWPPTRYVRPFAAIGFCGGFTTFSTFVVEVDRHVQHGQVATAAVYVLVSLAAGVLAAAAGVVLARGRSVRAEVVPDPDGPGTLGAAEPISSDERTRP